MLSSGWKFDYDNYFCVKFYPYTHSILLLAATLDPCSEHGILATVFIYVMNNVAPDCHPWPNPSIPLLSNHPIIMACVDKVYMNSME